MRALSSAYRVSSMAMSSAWHSKACWHRGSAVTMAVSGSTSPAQSTRVFCCRFRNGTAALMTLEGRACCCRRSAVTVALSAPSQLYIPRVFCRMIFARRACTAEGWQCLGFSSLNFPGRFVLQVRKCCTDGSLHDAHQSLMAQMIDCHYGSGQSHNRQCIQNVFFAAGPELLYCQCLQPK